MLIILKLLWYCLLFDYKSGVSKCFQGRDNYFYWLSLYTLVCIARLFLVKDIYIRRPQNLWTFLCACACMLRYATFLTQALRMSGHVLGTGVRPRQVCHKRADETRFWFLWSLRRDCGVHVGTHPHARAVLCSVIVASSAHNQEVSGSIPWKSEKWVLFFHPCLCPPTSESVQCVSQGCILHTGVCGWRSQFTQIPALWSDSSLL